MTPLFTMEDAERAYEEWGANCGPGALAAICGKTLEDVRPHIPLFAERRYTNPSMMFEALRNLARDWVPRADKEWPSWGLVRVQWEGPWTKPNVPMRARYRYTHWIGACARDRKNIGVFDINCMNNGTGWVSLSLWATEIVPWLTKQYPRADGKWHITHSLEVG